MRYVKVSVYAKTMGLSPQTIRRMYKSGELRGKQLESGLILIEVEDD